MAVRGRWLTMATAMVGAGLLAGCTPPKPLYYWGNSQAVLYKLHANPGGMNPSEAITNLTNNIRVAASMGMRVPPGEHAELGYLQYQAGDMAQAAAQFRLEKQLYPSSAPLMDRLLAKMQPQQPATEPASQPTTQPTTQSGAGGNS
ncbi:hypothetical protein ACOSOMT5_P0450 [Acidiphilium sp. MT5]